MPPGSGQTVATAYVRLQPDASGFKQEAQAQLNPVLADIQAKIAATRAQADALAARVDANRAAREAAGGSTSAIEGQTAALGALAARASIVAGIALEIKNTFDAAASRQSSLNLVAESVANAGDAWGVYGADVTKALDQQRAATGFAFSDIAEAFSRLENAFKDPKKALEELGVAEDVARGQGKDLAQVSLSISEAAQGQFSNLNQLGNVTKELTTQQDALKKAHAELIDSGETLSSVEQQQYQDRLKAAQAADRQATSEQALGELAARNAGQAKAYISSTSGQISQLRASLTQVEEQVGGPLLTVTGDLAQALNGAIQGYLRYTNLVGSGLHTITGLFDSATSSAEDFGNAAQEASQKGTQQQGLDKLVTLLRQVQVQAQAAGHLGKQGADVFTEALQRLARQNPELARQLTDLEGIAKAAGGLQNLSDVDIKVTLSAPDTTDFTNKIVAQLQRGLDAAAGPLADSFNASIAAGINTGNFTADQHLNPLTADPDARGGASDDPIKTKAKHDARTYETAFVQTIDAGDITRALDDAIGAARDQLSSSATSLAGAVGDALDKRLANTEKKIDDADARIQARIAARQAAADARNGATTQLDAATKLKELQDALGPGALTADQQVALQQAKDAVANAQDDIANAQDQAQSDALGLRKATLEKQEQAEKDAATRRIDDLTAEFNRGAIKQAEYVKGVNALLAKEQVNYKTTGQLLGTAFADGFADSLKGVLTQAKELGLVGASTLKGKATAAKPVSPLGDEAKAIKAFIDAVAGSGGRYNITNTADGKLPAGVNLSSLIAQGSGQRSETAYRVETTKNMGDTAHYTGQVADHTKQILDELKKANAKPPVVVDDGKTAKRKVAQATR